MTEPTQPAPTACDTPDSGATESAQPAQPGEEVLSPPYEAEPVQAGEIGLQLPAAEGSWDHQPTDLSDTVEERADATGRSEPTSEWREPVVVSAENLSEAVSAVREAARAGRCVVLPTDTVYGIGADPFSQVAVQSLLDAKQRGREMPPAVLVADAFAVDALARDIPEPARALAAAYWPGPLTLVLAAHSSLRLELGETRGTVGVRVPDHEVARAVLRATGPLAVSSANISGQSPGTDVESARSQLGDSVAVYVDAGPTPGPVGSTIVDFAASPNGRVLRVGVVPVSEIRQVAPLVEGPAEETPTEPDQPEEAPATTAVPEAETTQSPAPGPTADRRDGSRQLALDPGTEIGSSDTTSELAEQVVSVGDEEQPAVGTAETEPGK